MTMCVYQSNATRVRLKKSFVIATIFVEKQRHTDGESTAYWCDCMFLMCMCFPFQMQHDSIIGEKKLCERNLVFWNQPTELIVSLREYTALPVKKKTPGALLIYFCAYYFYVIFRFFLFFQSQVALVLFFSTSASSAFRIMSVIITINVPVSMIHCILFQFFLRLRVRVYGVCH